MRTAGSSASQSFFATANFSVAQVSFAQKFFILFDFNSMGLASGTSSFSLQLYFAKLCGLLINVSNDNVVTYIYRVQLILVSISTSKFFGFV